ncbi:MAG TPA: hypothetical protein VJP88_08670 [Caulobacteraceae bacterium]|nr:hypothetical protein [Caulobacteraceae bacterium]
MSPRAENAKLYGWTDGQIPETGAEVWVRAIVTDPCTSCCGVKVKDAHGRLVHVGYLKPADVRTDPAA